MAPIPSSTGTVRSSTDATFDAAGTAVTFAFDAGTDADRFLIVSITFDGPSSHTLGDTAVTYNGVAMTAFGATSVVNNCKKRTYGLIAPATGSNTVSVDPSAGIGSEDAVIEVYCYSGVDQTTPYDGYTTAQATDASAPLESPLTITSATGDLIWVSHGGRGSSIASGVATNFTERLDNVAGASNIAAVSGDASGAASVATSVAWSGPISVDYCVHGVNLNAITVGPTIDTQPTAQTALLHGEPTTGATFTVAATTSGGALSYDWELETSVGGGVYANLSDGSGATWTGQAAASCTGTFSATTLTGRRVRCNVTDSNGTVTTNAVTLTILNGPVLSATSGTTNGSGVSTTLTAGGVTKRIYVRAT